MVFRQSAFVTDDDIRNISDFQNQTIIAIKAPSGSTLAVPYPDQVREHVARLEPYTLHPTPYTLHPTP